MEGGAGSGLCEQAEEEPSEQAYASSFPLFNDPFIHLRDMVVPTLFQAHVTSRHTLLSPLIFNSTVRSHTRSHKYAAAEIVTPLHHRSDQ